MKKQMLRIKFSQDKAHFRREGMFEERLTYPMPPLSTVIGMVHSFSGFTSYREMNVSVQSKYSCINRSLKKGLTVFKNIEKDRGILVKNEFSDFSLCPSSYKKIAAFSGQGHLLKNYMEDDSIEIFDEEEVKRYLSINEKVELLISEKKSEKDKKLKEQINQEIKKEREKLKDYCSYNQTMYTVEELNDVECVVHIDSDKETLQEIKDNIHNISSCGRSEDFVKNVECSFVEVSDEVDVGEEDLKTLKDDLSICLNKNALNLNAVSLSENDGMCIATVFHINKDYEIKDGIRVFNRVKLINAPAFFLKDIASYNKKFGDLYLGIDEDGYMVNVM